MPPQLFVYSIGSGFSGLRSRMTVKNNQILHTDYDRGGNYFNPHQAIARASAASSGFGISLSP